jgi:hypothetical protein
MYVLGLAHNNVYIYVYHKAIKRVVLEFSPKFINLKQCVKDRLAHLLREEEIKWFQRAKTKELLQGDDNTKYFQLVANGKRRKTRIFRLEQEEGVIEGEEKSEKNTSQSTIKVYLGPPKKITGLWMRVGLKIFFK